MDLSALRIPFFFFFKRGLVSYDLLWSSSGVYSIGVVRRQYTAPADTSRDLERLRPGPFTLQVPESFSLLETLPLSDLW
jgi:hypothetical protein